jgi:hypothetical protein
MRTTWAALSPRKERNRDRHRVKTPAAVDLVWQSSDCDGGVRFEKGVWHRPFMRRLCCVMPAYDGGFGTSDGI